MPNSNLHTAKAAKNDEFYTQFEDIEAEMNAYYEYNRDVFRGKTILCPCDDPEWSNFTKYFAANFDRFELKKLISTSYAKSSGNRQITLFEMNSPKFDKELHETRGRIYVLEHDAAHSGRIDHNNIEFEYLEGDGDFRSEEVTRLRDEADIIITNPPFSLFRNFLAWIMEAEKQFVIVGNKNAITYKEVFPLIKDNKIWVGDTPMSKDLLFIVPEDSANEMIETKKIGSAYRIINGKVYGRAQAIWFTNIDHGKRHEPMMLMTMADNLKYNKKLRKKCEKEGWVDEKGKPYYPKYDNYEDLCEIPFTECIPLDYQGKMALPITFLDRHNPTQFEILGITQRNNDPYKTKIYTTDQYTNANDLNARGVIITNGVPKSMYARIIVRFKKGA